MYIYKIWNFKAQKYLNDYWVNEELVREEFNKLDKSEYVIHKFLPVFKEVLYDGK